MQLILASQSPRRRQLIRLIGQAVRLEAAAVDEESVDHPDERENVVATARLKAKTIGSRFPNALIIAADTTVALDGAMLGKPANVEEAIETLRQLRGRDHQVYTGTVLFQSKSAHIEEMVCGTDVVMRPYSDSEIINYVRSGDPFDKAGAYAIQNAQFHPVANIRGCYTNVVGLPLCQLSVALRRFGIDTDIDVANDATDYSKCALCLELMADDALK